MVKLRDCAVRELEACDDQTPANIAESLFNFVIRVTPCKKLLGTAYDNNNNKAFSTLESRDSSSSTLIRSSIIPLLIILPVLRIV